MIILETERFFLREFEAADALSLYLLNSDEEVLRFTGDKPFESIQHASQFLEKYDHYRQHGFGRWAVIDKITGEFTGWCGLKYQEQQDEVDIGYRFFKRFWNEGYATETASACLVYGFEKLGIESIVGRAMKANPASIRVFEKVGMHFDHEFLFDGHEGLVYVKYAIKQ